MIKLIIADDEKLSLCIISKLLNWEELGYEISALCSDGKEVLSHMCSENIDVILTDIKMPVIDGIELARICRDLYPAVKIIFMSAYHDFEYARNALQYGVKEYILKPLTYEELYKVMSGFAKDIDSNNIMGLLPNEVNSYEKQQLFTKIIEGSIKGRSAAEESFASLGLDKSIIDNECVFFKIHIKNFDEYCQKVWKHSTEGLYRAVSSIIYTSIKDMHCIITGYLNDVVEVVAICNENGKSAESFFTEHSKELTEVFSSLINMSVEIETVKTSKSLLSLGGIARSVLSDPSISSNAIIFKAMNYISINYKTATLSGVSQHVSLNPSYFSVYFKNATGENFVDAVNRIRLDKAKKLLYNPNIKSSNVYELVGYKSYPYFYKKFYEQFETTPGQYQKSVLKGEIL